MSGARLFARPPLCDCCEVFMLMPLGCYSHETALRLIVCFCLLCALYCEISILWEYYRPSSKDEQDKSKKSQRPCKADDTARGNFGKLRSQYKNFGLFLGNLGHRIKSSICFCIRYFLTKLFNSILKFFRIAHGFIRSQRRAKGRGGSCRVPLERLVR